MLVTDTGGKEFEKPESGIFLGTIIDVVDLGLVPNKDPKLAAQVRVRILWVLDKNDSEGNPFRVMEQPTAKISSAGVRPSRLYEICVGVLGTAPPVPFDTEALIGKSNQLFITKEGQYSNIKGFLPLPAGAVAPKAPANFVRAKDRSKPGTTQAEPAQTVNLNSPSQQPAVSVPDQDIPF